MQSNNELKSNNFDSSSKSDSIIDEDDFDDQVK